MSYYVTSQPKAFALAWAAGLGGKPVSLTKRGAAGWCVRF